MKENYRRKIRNGIIIIVKESLDDKNILKQLEIRAARLSVGGTF